MRYEYLKLRARIIEKYGTQESFADAIKRSRVCVSQKLNGKSAFNKSTIELWSNALDIPISEIGSYFFE